MPETKIDTNSGFILKNPDSVFVQGTTEAILFKYLVKGGTLGRAKDLRLEIFGELSTNSAVSTIPTLSISVEFAGNVLPILNGLKLSTDQSSKPFALRITVGNRFDRGGSNLQTLRTELLPAANMFPAINQPGATLASLETYADLASDALLQVKAKFNNQTALPVNGSDEMVKYLAIMEVK